MPIVTHYTTVLWDDGQDAKLLYDLLTYYMYFCFQDQKLPSFYMHEKIKLVYQIPDQKLGLLKMSY